MRQFLAHLHFRLDWLSGRTAFWVLVLVVALAGVSVVSLMLGAVSVPIGSVLPALVDDQNMYHTLLQEVRTPRVLAAALVGIALAMSGALIQTVVRNPLADPALLGVTAGAGVFALVGILFLPGYPFLLPWLALVGAAMGLGLVLVATTAWGGAVSPLRIILSGVAQQAVLFSVIAALSFFFAERAPAFATFTVGSLASAGWRDVAILAAPVAIGLGASFVLIPSLDVLLLDDASASGVGVPIMRLRLVICCVAALLAGAAVSAAGLVGFVGLVVPNAVRLAVGSRHGVLLPLTALAGATLVVAADLAARTAAAPLEIPVGVLLALLGGPFMLYLLWRKTA